MKPRPHIRACSLVALLLGLAFPVAAEAIAIDGYASLLAAIEDGNRQGSATIALSSDIALKASLPAITGEITIEGNGYAINGADSYRIFRVHAGKLTINNLTLEKGNARGLKESGGAIWLEGGAHLRVHNAIFRDNQASHGGAIGIGAGASVVGISDSSFSGNRAQIGGGAIYSNSFRSRIQIASSSFVDNRADKGGAIYAWNTDTLEIENSAFSDNVAQRGGAIAARRAHVTLTHLSMLNNAAYGAGIYREMTANGTYSGAIRLRNSLITSAGAPPDCQGRLTQNIGSFIADGSCAPKLSGDPMLGEATGSPLYIPLKPGSPAIDAGYPGYCLATDQLGNARAQFGNCDIGAVEYMGE